MVVPAGDLELSDQGFESDASEAIPLDDYSLIPSPDDNAAPIDADGDEGAASSDSLPEFDFESLPEVHREALAAHFRASLEQEFEERRRDFQSVKDRETALAVTEERERAQAAIAARANVYAKYFKDMGVDERDFKALEHDVAHETRRLNELRQRQKAQTQQVYQQQQTAVQEFQTWQTDVTQQMREHVKTLGLNAEDATINQRFQRVLDAAKVWNETPTQAAHAHYLALKEEHKAWVGTLAASAKKRQAAKPASDALNRQRARGPQNLSRGGTGAAPMTFKDHVAAVQRQNPSLDYESVHQLANSQFLASQRPR